MKILVVEDEQRLAEAIKEGLEQETYAVDIALDGATGYNNAVNDDYDLIILDVMLPEMNGYQVCEKLRGKDRKVPILMLTAKSHARDVVEGLDVGADDYLAKPFSFEVLLARIRALLRRPALTVDRVLVSGSLSLDPSQRRISRSGVEINLSAKEYAILEYLMRNKGNIVSKNKIIRHVWNFEADVLPNNVEAFISMIRNKIETPFSEPKLIETIRGFGYRIKG